MVRWVRPLAKRIFQMFTRHLHPRYRRAARRRLAGGEPPRSVLFLCLGNVCRSPYAQAAFSRMAPNLPIDSAGFIGPGRAANEKGQEVAAERGLDLSFHVSKVVTPELARRFDLIVVMEPRQRASLQRKVGATAPVLVLGDLDPLNAPKRGITDPWGKGTETFRGSFDRIDRCLAELLPFLEAPRSAADA